MNRFNSALTTSFKANRTSTAVFRTPMIKSVSAPNLAGVTQPTTVSSPVAGTPTAVRSVSNVASPVTPPPSSSPTISLNGKSFSFPANPLAVPVVSPAPAGVARTANALQYSERKPSETTEISTKKAAQMEHDLLDEEQYSFYALDAGGPETASEDTNDNDNVLHSEEIEMKPAEVVPAPQSQKTKVSKKVSFWPMASVVLIPTKEEYFNAGLHVHLWWSAREMHEFKTQAYSTALQLMETFDISRVKDAFKRMIDLVDHSDVEAEAVEKINHLSLAASKIRRSESMHNSLSSFCAQVR